MTEPIDRDALEALIKQYTARLEELEQLRIERAGRDREIVQQVAAGATKVSLARRFGLSTERIRQIIKAAR